MLCIGLALYKLQKEQTCCVLLLYLLSAKIGPSWQNVLKIFMESTEKHGPLKRKSLRFMYCRHPVLH